MQTIKTEELKKKLDRKEVVLVDVREPGEHRTEYIDGAHLIPLGTLSVGHLSSRSHPVVVHCHSGKRSLDACQKLLKEDPTLEIYSLEGGIVAWKQAGFNTQKSGAYLLPLDRQTQLIAGFLAFLGTLLGTFSSAQFYFIPGFVGLGLMVAGLTGWCGMAKLLAKMPWNR